MISLCRTVRMSSYQRYLSSRQELPGRKKNPSLLYLNFRQIKLFQRITTSFQVWLMLYSPEGLHNQISLVSVATARKHLVAELSTQLSCIQKLKAVFWRGTVPIQPHGDLAIPICQDAQLHIVSHKVMLLQGRYKVHHSKNPVGWGISLGIIARATNRTLNAKG